MYSVFLDGWRFPVSPSKLDVKIKGKNKTLTLINDGEINILKAPGLTEIDNLEIILPMLEAYPFAVYPEGFKTPDYYLSKIEALVTEKRPAQFIVSRVSPSGRLLFGTNLKVSVEEYTIKENASDGPDVTVSIKLKQYRDFSTKIINVTHTEEPQGVPLKVGDIVDFIGSWQYVSSTGDAGSSARPGKARLYLISSGAKHPYSLIHIDSTSNVYGWVNASDIAGVTTTSTTSASEENGRNADSAPKVTVYTVKKGDCLWSIAKKFYGDGSRYKEIYEANKSVIDAHHGGPNMILEGDVLTIP